MIRFVDDRRAVDVISLDFSKVFNAVSDDILVSKLGRYGLDGYTISGVNNLYLEPSNNWGTAEVCAGTSPV